MLEFKAIEHILIEIDNRIQALLSFTDQLREIKTALALLKDTADAKKQFQFNEVLNEIQELKKSYQNNNQIVTNDYEKKYNYIRQKINSDEWPKAVDDESICLTEEDLVNRAKNILTFFVGEVLIDKKILDFGCGEGHVVNEALKLDPQFVLGYDRDPKVFKFNKENFTSDLKEVISKGPYDIIILHDVLDHLTDASTVEILSQVRTMLTENGRAYIKIHPWCSRHGGHLYTQKNKAFLHLILDEVELTRYAGIQSEYTIHITHPLDTYRIWIEEAGFDIQLELPVRTPVEDFFTSNKIVYEKLKAIWPDQDLITPHMELDFIEYILTPKNLKLFQIF